MSKDSFDSLGAVVTFFVGPRLGEFKFECDLLGIAREITAWDEQRYGFVVVVDTVQFWEIVKTFHHPGKSY